MKKHKTKIIWAVAVAILAAVIVLVVYATNKENPETGTRGLILDEAVKIAEKSECTEKGTLTPDYFYNGNTKTWWINLAMKEEFQQENCYPACVVSEETKTAEINWRCTGLLPE
jgi:hypothetical protein